MNNSTMVHVQDQGNRDVKAKSASGREDTFPRAIVPITMEDYNRGFEKRLVSSEDYYIVNGVPICVGAAAWSHGVLAPLTGATKYIRESYGNVTAVSMFRNFDRGGDVFVYAGMPTGDGGYADSLYESIAGAWEVEQNGSRRTFNVIDGNTFDEVMGGVYNILLTEDGLKDSNTEEGKIIRSGRVLGMDFGGRTFDMQSFQKGKPSADVVRSVNVGVLDVLYSFEDAILANHPAKFRGIRSINQSMLESAYESGVYSGGGEIDVSDEKAKASNPVMNRIREAYYRFAGGPAQWDAVLLTGGGSVLLNADLCAILDHPRVLMAESPADIQKANVRGGLKMYRFGASRNLW